MRAGRTMTMVLASISFMVGCSQSSPAPQRSNGPLTSPAVGNERNALMEVSRDRHVSNLVVTAGGLEAATWRPVPGARAQRDRWAASGPITFWRLPPGATLWQRVGTSRYPSMTVQGCDPRVQAGAVTGASDAVYIVRGCYTGDGVLNAVAFSNGPRGWGAVSGASPTRLIATGHPGRENNRIGISPPNTAWFDIEFRHHLLETIVGNNGFFSDAADRFYGLRIYWVWKQRDFRAVTNNAFQARRSRPPPLTAPGLPSGACPTNGSYRAGFGVVLNLDGRRASGTAPLHFDAFPAADRFPAISTCQQILDPRFPIHIEVAHGNPHDYFAHPGPLTRKQWVTAPAWMLLKGTLGDTGVVPLFPGTVGPWSSYRIAKSFRVNLMLVKIGDILSPHFKRDFGENPHPTVGILTWHAKRLTGITIYP